MTCLHCAKPAYIRGLCSHHYKQDRIASAPTCSVEGCERHAYSRGYCEMHYGRMRTHGRTSKPARTPRDGTGNRNKGRMHNRFKHGKTSSPTYKAWVGMKRRCYTEDSKDFKNYGGRGIEVCDRWRDSFENFLSDMGERPSPSMSIDRIDNDGNYEPANCRWADKSTQMSNRRFVITSRERAKAIREAREDGWSLKAISKEFGISESYASVVARSRP